MKETRLSGSEKLLIISNEFPPGPGGIGNHAFNLARYLNKRNIETDVVTVSDFVTDDEANEFDAKAEFRITRHKRHSSRLRTYLDRIRDIKSAANSNQYSHIIFSGRSSLLVSMALRKNKMKFVAIAHGGDVNAKDGIEKQLISNALKKMDLIVPVSRYSAGKLPESVSSQNVNVIPNGFDFENIDSIGIESGKNLNKDLALITVGSVWPRKGQHNVLRVLPKLKSEFPGITYNIVGRKNDMSEVDKYLDDKLSESVKIHGQVTLPRLQELLTGSDIFIMLSETEKSGDFEGFGIAVIEANCFGIPAIGSRESGLEDAISHGKSGMLVDPKNDDEIMSAFREIVSRYDEFSANAVSWAKEHHWSKIVTRYIDSIRSIPG